MGSSLPPHSMGRTVFFTVLHSRPFFNPMVPDTEYSGRGCAPRKELASIIGNFGDGISTASIPARSGLPPHSQPHPNRCRCIETGLPVRRQNDKMHTVSVRG